MKTFSAKAASLLLLTVFCGAFGCASSERQAARQIDRTSAIAREASTLIAADRELSRFPIVVDGFHNDMRLKGHVATPAQKSRAEKMVWAIQGVKSVQNDLVAGNEATAAKKVR